MERWCGKVAIVTGASAGIGAAICEKLVSYGVIVVGLARRLEKLEALSKKLQNKKGKFFHRQTDIKREEDILKAFKWTRENIGPVSILINNAGIASRVDLTNTPTEKVKELLDTNVIGLYVATREACKIMMENNIDGHIVHISSIAGHAVISAESGVYSASKHAVMVLTETLRKELVNKNSKIKISCISPGCVDTDMLASSLREMQIHDKIPMLKSEDIADSVVYVISSPPHVQIHEVIIKPVGEKF